MTTNPSYLVYNTPQFAVTFTNNEGVYAKLILIFDSHTVFLQLFLYQPVMIQDILFSSSQKLFYFLKLQMELGMNLVRGRFTCTKDFLSQCQKKNMMVTLHLSNSHSIQKKLLPLK